MILTSLPDHNRLIPLFLSICLLLIMLNMEYAARYRYFMKHFYFCKRETDDLMMNYSYIKLFND